MIGYCENCAKVEYCTKDIGLIWGFCNTDFAPWRTFWLKDKESGRITHGEWIDEKAAKFFADSAGMIVIGEGDKYDK